MAKEVFWGLKQNISLELPPSLYDFLVSITKNPPSTGRFFKKAALSEDTVQKTSFSWCRLMQSVMRAHSGHRNMT